MGLTEVSGKGLAGSRPRVWAGSVSCEKRVNRVWWSLELSGLRA